MHDASKGGQGAESQMPGLTLNPGPAEDRHHPGSEEVSPDGGALKGRAHDHHDYPELMPGSAWLLVTRDGWPVAPLPVSPERCAP